MRYNGLITVYLFLATSLVSGQDLNRQMRVDTLVESEKINPEPDKAYVHVSSQIPNLRFDSNRNLDQVNQLSSGDWELWLPAGTHILKIDAEGFQRLELEPYTFARKRSYELKISAVGFAPTSRADENLFEVSFQCDQDSVYSSYGDFTPTLSKSRTVTYKLPQGEYTFRFQKPGFQDYVRTVKVTASSQEPMTLKPGVSRSMKGLTLPGVILVTSDPAGAEIILNGQRIGTTPFQSDLAAGNHQLELRKPMYEPSISAFTLEEGKNQTLNIKLQPRFGYLSVTSSQPNSKVSLDGKPLGLAPISREVVESTTHTLNILADLYHRYTEEFTIKNGEEKIVNAALKPAFGSLEVSSEPESGAEVFLDGRKVGVTPYTDQKIPSGKYSLKVTRPMFNDAEEEITISDGETTTRAVTLSPNFGELDITAEGSSISIDGQLKARDKYYARLAPGSYKVTAGRGEKYVPAEQQVFLAINEKKDILLTPQPRMGSLTVLVEPYPAHDADIYVDAQLKGKAPLVLPLLIGDYQITAKKSDFLDLSKPVSIEENAQQRLTLDMITYQGSLEQKRHSWATAKWVSFAATVAAGAAVYYFNSKGNDAYNSYKLAGTVEDADSYRTLTTKYNTYFTISISVAGTALVSIVVSWIVQASY